MENCPLSNQPCSNPKNLQYTFSQEEDFVSHNICQSCPYFFIFKDLLFLTCELCGACYMEIQRTKKFGCPKCYDKFNEVAKSFFSICQTSFEHVGKKPDMLDSLDIIQLVSKIDEAISVEDYELADRCKKIIIRRAMSQYPKD